ncbi:MAG: ABC transporter permease, partial [Thaumarchaeota archaeon]|nr:ABC transporter permease [Nitrososphaerota archaeon]
MTAVKLSRDTLQVTVLAVITVAFALIAEILAPGFLRIGHLSFMLEVTAILGILSIAQTIVIMTGGIDMSTGAIMYLMMATAPMLMKTGFFIPFLLCLAIGALVGAVNGGLIAWADIPPIVQTIAMMVALTGVVFVRTGGSPGGKAHPLLRAMTIEYVGPLHMATIIWIVITIIFFFVIHATV